MGRAWKVSNPTEVNSSWVPSGDDAAGIYYTQQTYDWKGRPLSHHQSRLALPKKPVMQVAAVLVVKL